MYKRQEQELVAAGSTSDGTMKYAVSADGSQPDDGSYDTSIPTGKDAGTYYVWYLSLIHISPISDPDTRLP